MSKVGLVSCRCSGVITVQMDIGSSWDVVQSSPYILIDADRLVGTPDESATEEGKEEHESVVELSLRSSHIELIEEPVEVQEWRGEFVKDERAAIVVDKRSL